MRGDQLARQWRLLRLIEANPQGLSVADLAQREDVSLRTAYRDLEALQEAGFPLYAEKADKAQRWAFVDAYRFKVPPPFTLTELMSLHLYGGLLRAFRGTAVFDSLASLLKKVRASLPPQAMAYLERLQAAFTVGLGPSKDYGRFRELLHQVSQATVNHRRVELAYLPLRSDTETFRKVDPYRVLLQDGTVYLIGFCHLRQQVRMFVLERIKLLRVTEERFDPPPDFDLQAYMGGSFKVLHDELVQVRVRISPAWARYVGERVWHESQRAARLPDGSLELSFQVAGLEEIRQWILSLGPQAEALEPPRLRELIRESLEQTLGRYRSEAAAEERRVG